MSNDRLTERKERWARKMAGQERTVVHSTARLPPGQHLTTGFPVLDLGFQPLVPLDEWRLEIKGLVQRPVTLDWTAIQALPRFEDTSDLHCVTTWSKYDCHWSGVAFATLLALVEPLPAAGFVYFEGYDDYSTNLPLEACLDEDVLVATAFDGQPLTREHGAPARVIVPRLYAWKGAKFLRSIELRAEDKLGFWEVRGYSNTADPWTNDRFS
jgi:DMSO/TMAO reductase YedYZ molybdopterin-dependent catalytic subunit